MADSRDLATLAQVKAYIASGSQVIGSTDDVTLAQMITAASLQIAEVCSRNYLGYGFCAQNVTEIRNGTGLIQMRTRLWPILSITSITVGSNTLSAATGLTGGGYTFTQQWINLRGGAGGSTEAGFYNGGVFSLGFGNVELVYTGGYNTPGMTAVQQLPAWVLNTSYAAGAQILVVNSSPTPSFVFTALTAGTSSGTIPTFPTALGDTVSDGSGATEFTWQATSVALPLIPNAPSLPYPLSQACIQHAAYLYAKKSQSGMTGSQSAGMDRLNYAMFPMEKWTRTMIDPYIDVSAQFFGFEESP